MASADELEALRAIYADAEFTQTSGSPDSCTVSVAFGSPRSFTACLLVPNTYPSANATIILTSAMTLSRAAIAHVNAALGAAPENGSRAGEPHLMQLIESCSETVTAARAASAPSDSLLSELVPELGYARVWIWFHHIMAPHKRRCIESWASELHVAGVCKPGFPGVLVAHGPAASVAEYVARLKALRWQAMVVREEERWEAAPPSLTGDRTASAAAYAPGRAVTDVGDSTGIGDSTMVLVGEGDMEVVAGVAERWGCLATFRSAILRLRSG